MEGVDRSKYSIEDLEAEMRQIEDCFLTLRFAQKIRYTSLACMKQLGGPVKFPYRVDQLNLQGKQYMQFGDCMNINLENGPFLSELGTVPEGKITKKFIWAHGLNPKVYDAEMKAAEARPRHALQQLLPIQHHLPVPAPPLGHPAPPEKTAGSPTNPLPALDAAGRRSSGKANSSRQIEIQRSPRATSTREQRQWHLHVGFTDSVELFLLPY